MLGFLGCFGIVCFNGLSRRGVVPQLRDGWRGLRVNGSPRPFDRLRLCDMRGRHVEGAQINWKTPEVIVGPRFLVWDAFLETKKTPVGGPAPLE